MGVAVGQVGRFGRSGRCYRGWHTVDELDGSKA